MKTGPKFKIARRLGAPIFEKTQTQKFAIASNKKQMTSKKRRSIGRTDFGIQLVEKQKARFSYGISERQFSKYVNSVLAKKDHNKQALLLKILESRLDNTLYRAGFALTRRAARQLVSHGHITLNGRKVTVPSIEVKQGDVITVRDGSKDSKLFTELEEWAKGANVPNWLSPDIKLKQIKVTGDPSVDAALLFNVESILDYYRR